MTTYSRDINTILDNSVPGGDKVEESIFKNSDAIDDIFTNVNDHASALSKHSDWPTTSTASNAGLYLRGNAGGTGYEFGDVNAYVATYVASNAADTLLSNLASNATAQTNLGGTTVGRALFTAASASNARSTLGLVIGTNVQAYDADIIKADAAITQPGNLECRGILTTATSGDGWSFKTALYPKGGKLYKADADASTTMPVVAIGVGTVASNASGSVLLFGIFRDDSAAWLTSAAALPFFASTSPGVITQTRPSGSGDQVQILGKPLTSVLGFFNPSPVVVEVA